MVITVLFHMRFLDQITTRLDSMVGVRYEREPDRVIVPAARPAGFAVRIIDHGGSWTILYDEHEITTREADEAANTFFLGLSDRIRLVLTKRRGKTYRWTVQIFDNGDWVVDDESRRVWIPFWQPTTRIVRQNNLLRDRNQAPDAESGNAQG